MISQIRIPGLLLIAASLLPGQTAGVQNAASASGFSSFRLGYSAISNVVSPGMLAVLSYSVLAYVEPPPLAATVSIRPSGSSTPIRVDVTALTPGSATFVVPRNMPLGGAEIEYKPAGQPTAWTNVNVVPASFEFYRNGPGGPAIAHAVAPDGSLSPIGLTTPAQPGQTIRLTGTGLGNVTAVSITIGGVPATDVSAQPHRTQPGLDEMLIRIPSGSPDGCYVPLALTYNTTTVTSTISKTSTGAPCAHPFQLSVGDMKTLDSGGVLNTGQINMSTTLQVASSTAASRNESANINISQMTAAGIASYLAPLSSQACATNPLGAVAVFAGFLYANSNSNTPLPNLGASMPLQSPATTLTLTGGPNNYSATLPQSTEGPLTSPPTPVITGGTWTWKSVGSPDLPASSFTFTIPAPFQLNGTAPVSPVHNQDQTINWNGAAFDSGATLNASLTGAGASGSVLVSCSVPASSGALTIPAAVLAQYGPNALGTLNLSIHESGSAIPHAQFKLQNGTTLLMLVNYSAVESLPVDLQ